MRPITPQEAARSKQERIPDEIVGVFNDLIVENLRQGQAIIILDDALARSAEVLKMTSDKILFNNWMDVEPIFREAGWDVEFDKPGYNEPGKSKYIFKKGKKR